jgi:hypothetical protein
MTNQNIYTLQTKEITRKATALAILKGPLTAANYLQQTIQQIPQEAWKTYERNMETLANTAVKYRWAEGRINIEKAAKKGALETYKQLTTPETSPIGNIQELETLTNKLDKQAYRNNLQNMLQKAQKGTLPTTKEWETTQTYAHKLGIRPQALKKLGGKLEQLAQAA